MEIYFEKVNYCNENNVNRLLSDCIEEKYNTFKLSQTTKIDFSSFMSLNNFNGFGILTGTCICSGNEK